MFLRKFSSRYNSTGQQYVTMKRFWWLALGLSRMSALIEILSITCRALIEILSITCHLTCLVKDAFAF